GAAPDGPERGAVGEHGDDDLAGRGEFPGRTGQPDAAIGQRGRPAGGPVPDREREAVPVQAEGHGQAHVPQAGEAYAHGQPARTVGASSPPATRVSPRPAGVFRWDWLSRRVFSDPPAVQYFWPATKSSSAGNLVMTSQP